MSQINDALKRASQASQKNLTPGAPPPLPLSAEPHPKQLNPALLGVIVLALLLIAAFVFTRLWRNPPPNPTVSAPPPIVTVTPPPKPIAPPTPTATPPASIVAPVVTATPPSPRPTTPPPPPATPPPPTFPSLKLQAIFYSKKPQALLNGQLLSLGDTLSGVRLQSLTPDSATLQWNNQTKTLHLAKR